MGECGERGCTRTATRQLNVVGRYTAKNALYRCDRHALALIEAWEDDEDREVEICVPR